MSVDGIDAGSAAGRAADLYVADQLARFAADMDAAGFEVEHYHGRSYWHGPAVSADSVWDVEQHTDVKLQSDSLGLGVIVYPRVEEPDYFGCAR